MSLLPVAEAQARLLALAAPLAIETVPLAAAAGRRLAADLVARRSQPAVALSAMDGYAIRFADMAGPWTVIGESAAGRGLDRAVGRHEAARIFTGAPMPAGADTIVVQEDVARDGDRVALTANGPAARGASVRAAASDFAAGAILAAAGDAMGAARIGLAAMGGYGHVPVRRRPRVVLISTGDELVPPGVDAPPPLLPASNGPMLAAMLAPLGAEVRDAGIVPDRLDALAAAFAAAAGAADVVVTIGGASVGDHDLVRPALAAAGAALDFWRVAMRPGKPLMAGRLGDAVVLGLPGNPVSAFVTAQLFLLPVLRHLGGDPAPLPAPVRRATTRALGAVGDRADYVRAWRVPEGVEPLASRDSAQLAELARADALIVRPAGAPPLAAGEICETLSIA